jgi:hypothetical protein
MKKIFLAVFLLFLPSCVAIQPTIKEDFDKATNVKKIYLTQNLCPQNSSGSVEFNMGYRFEYTSTLWITIRYFAQHWLSISAGKSLVLFVDSEKIELSGDGSINKRHAINYGIDETARYPISIELLDKLVHAHKIEGKLYGTYYYESFFLDKTNRDALRKFRAKVIE